MKEAKTWAQAQAWCRADAPDGGSDLATVTSAEEHAFLSAMCDGSSASTPDIWVGGNDLAKDGTWVWSGEGQAAVCAAAAVEPLLRVIEGNLSTAHQPAVERRRVPI